MRSMLAELAIPCRYGDPAWQTTTVKRWRRGAVVDRPSCAELGGRDRKRHTLSQKRGRRAREAAQLGLLSAQPAPAHVP